MMLLTTRLRLDANGKPHIPGSLEVWRNLFVNHPQGKYDGKLTRIAISRADPIGEKTGWHAAMPVTQWVWTKP